MPGTYFRIGKQNLTLTSKPRQYVPLIRAPMLRRRPTLRVPEPHHAEPAQDDREPTNGYPWNRRRTAMGHALYRAGVLVRRIREHHARHLARVRMVIQADDVPAK